MRGVAKPDNQLRHIPDLVEYADGWALEGFTPLSSAWNYPAVKDKPAFIYAFSSPDDITKIGRSSAPMRRIDEIRKKWEAPLLEIIKAEPVPYAGSMYAERLLHIKFADRELSREWFDIPAQEFLDALPYALIGARLYDEACRKWHEDSY